jgi:hypothetical protein
VDVPPTQRSRVPKRAATNGAVDFTSLSDRIVYPDRAARQVRGIEKQESGT